MHKCSIGSSEMEEVEVKIGKLISHYQHSISQGLKFLC
jgi:hypothetical protein